MLTMEPNVGQWTVSKYLGAFHNKACIFFACVANSYQKLESSGSVEYLPKTEIESERQLDKTSYQPLVGA